MKKIIFDKEAREGLVKGITTLAKAVKITLGARGRNVLIEDLGGNPHITKDGVTVARAVEVEDSIEAQGVKLMKQVALKTNDTVGDGTTSSIVLAESIIKEGMKAVDSGMNPIFLKRGMDKALRAILLYLDKISVKVTGTNFLNEVATISANNDEEVGKLISDSFAKVGKNGTIKVKPSTNNESKIVHEKGLEFDRGYMARFSVTNQEEGKAELKDNPLVLITDYSIGSLNNFNVVDGEIPLFEDIIEQGRDLLIICNNMELVPLQRFDSLKAQGVKVVPVKAPEFGDRRDDILEDIAIATGGTYISESGNLTLKDITLEHLGEAKEIIVTDDTTIIYNGTGKKEVINKRIKFIKSLIDTETEEYAKSKLEERLAKLSKGVAVIYVGANSEVELREVKDRVEDSINATKAAISEGVVAGGGVALYHFDLNAEDLTKDPEELVGVQIVLDAIKQPAYEIINNSGENTDDVLEKIRKGKQDSYVYGYDVKGKKYGNMFDLKIIDPVKVVKTSLINAISVSGTLITTGCVIASKEVTVPVPNFTI